MGLRFRKSISLIPGVRLNFGKTGMSVSTGVPGFRKTFHTSGRVTTSVGIPGTGLYYGSNYEFGTDDSKKIEVEFNVNIDALTEARRELNNTEYNFLLQDYVCSVCIRIARDMFALLPIKNTIVHTVLNGATILSVNFDRQGLSKLKFGYIDPSDALKQFECNMNFNELTGFSPVNNLE